MLFTLASYLCIRGIRSGTWTDRQLILQSLTLAAALLTRMDSAILVIVSLILTGASVRRKNLRSLAALILPLVTIVGIWMAWKLSYYGNILPNTFYLKASSITSVGRGLNYLYVFLNSYFLWPFLAAGIFFGNHLLKKENRTLLPLAALTLLWILYVLKVGGDFMEFRMLVPVMPAAFILIVRLLLETKPILQTLGIAVMLAGTIHHQTTFTYSVENGIEPVGDLYGHIKDEDKNWAGIGKTLGRTLGYDTSVTVATTAAGAIPYYSRLGAIDMLGINDPWVARNGIFIGTTPGHQRIAPFSYLVERGANLIVSHPMVMPLAAPVTQFPILPGGEEVNDVRVVEIPLDDRYKFLAAYLTPNRTVDETIARERWKVHVVRRLK